MSLSLEGNGADAVELEEVAAVGVHEAVHGEVEAGKSRTRSRTFRWLVV
jgi:hypothetical protein